MRFSALRWHWERLGRRDPLWAVLTDSSKRGGRWEIDEFFRSGAAEIAAVLEHGGELGLPAKRQRALDFGCGAGRLTQAMATHFDRADGVDISAAMLRTARQHNRHPDRCTYHLNLASDLARFSGASFDFIYTTLVLQHMAPSLSRTYIRELIRVLAPGGLLVFQLPSQRSTTEPSSEARRTMVTDALPAAAVRAHLTVETPPPASIGLGVLFPLEVTVVNASDATWPSLPDARGKRQLFVGYRWRLDDAVVLFLTGRCPLAVDLTPGARTTAMLSVTAPSSDGRYVLEIDMVQEDVTWFGERGSDPLRLPVVVGTGISAIRPQPESTAALPAFRVRHPRAYALMRATGIRDVYWIWRRSLDRLKRVRDAVIIFFQKRPEIPRWIAWWKDRPFAGKMAMHWIPRAEVVALIEEAGGRVLQVDEERTPGYLSCKYWVTRSD